MIPMVLNVGSLTGMQTLTLVFSFAGFLVEQIGSVTVYLAEDSGLPVAGGLGTLDIFAGSLTCLVGHY